jgi:type IV pilus assembly protein PilW
MKSSTITTREAQTGFSMVELMVSLTLSLILLAGVLSLVYSSKITYLENQRVAGNQEGARAAFEMILRDLRGSGFPGCSQPVATMVTSQNILANPTSLLWALDVPLQGYEGSSGTWAPALDPLLTGAAPPPSPGNDIIAIRTIHPGQPQFRTTVGVDPDDDIVVAKTATQQVAGNTFVIGDYQAETFFEATVTDNKTTATLKRDTTGTPSNGSADLLAAFKVGALVTSIDTVVYYIAPSATAAVQNGQPGPSLWRIVSSANNAAPQEVIPDVERMEVQYGLDTNADNAVDEYDNADVINAAGTWSNVISVRIAILVRSAQANSPEVDKKTYTLLDTVVKPFNDHYERSLYTTTVTLRNRTP